MLVLSRKKNESIKIGNDIEVVVYNVSGSRVKIGVRAPDHVTIRRNEMCASNGVDTL
jgi:carbon storage regulator